MVQGSRCKGEAMGKAHDFYPPPAPSRASLNLAVVGLLNVLRHPVLAEQPLDHLDNDVVSLCAGFLAGQTPVGTMGRR